MKIVNPTLRARTGFQSLTKRCGSLIRSFCVAMAGDVSRATPCRTWRYF
jgi:hypothetical protein